jgi:hypothetical protein
MIQCVDSIDEREPERQLLSLGYAKHAVMTVNKSITAQLAKIFATEKITAPNSHC